MIHYHGAEISGGVLSKKALAGRHALVSFEHDVTADIAQIAQTFVLDNGAFTAWTRGRNKGAGQWDDYYSFVEIWAHHPGFDWAIIPDVIDGDESENDSLLTEWPFAKWQGVPVWHMHESLDRLRRLAAEWPRLALGSSGQFKTPGADPWWHRMAEAMGAVCVNGKPVTKLHGLRMLDPQIFTFLPLSSADSANAAINAGSLSRFGQYKPPSAALRATVLMDRIEQHQSAPIWAGYQREQLCLGM